MVSASTSSSTQEYAQWMRELGLATSSNGNDAIHVRVEHVVLGMDSGSWATILLPRLVHSIQALSYSIAFALVAWGTGQVIRSFQNPKKLSDDQ
jgi:hypothetical protein